MFAFLHRSRATVAAVLVVGVALACSAASERTPGDTGPALACFDFNGDGFVSNADIHGFLDAYQSGQSWADLNYDGVVDASDASIAHASEEAERTPRTFTAHWAVTGEDRAGRVEITGLPIERDVIVVYHSDLRLLDDAGLATLLRSPDAGAVASALARAAGDRAAVAAGPHAEGKIVLLDVDRCARSWAWIRGRQPDLFENVAPGPDDEAAWSELASRLVLGMVERLRELRPGVRIGLWGIPDGMTRTFDLARVLANLDVVTVDLVSSSPAGPDRVGWTREIGRARALRQAYAPRAPVLAIIACHDDGTDAAERVRAARASIEAPRYAGADGVVLWTHVADAGGLAQPEALEESIWTHWAGTMRRHVRHDADESRVGLGGR